MRTPLTYYGGKQKLAAQIVALMPPHTAYLEPFAGGAAVLFAKPPAPKETLNDLDGEIVRFWRALRERPDELAAAAAATPYSRAEWEACADPADDDVEAARRLLVRLGHSFQKEGRNWSPPSLSQNRWQPATWATMPPRLLAAAERLRGVCLECTDAIDLIARWDLPGTVIYLDPPYSGAGRKQPCHGYRHDAEDLWPRLIDALSEVDHAAVLLSGYPNEEVDRLDWRRVQLRAVRGVPVEGAMTVAPETLWLSPSLTQHSRLFDDADLALATSTESEGAG